MHDVYQCWLNCYEIHSEDPAISGWAHEWDKPAAVSKGSLGVDRSSDVLRDHPIPLGDQCPRLHRHAV